jgi:hypothetical protein
MSKIGATITTILLLGGALLMSAFPVWGDETPGNIHGVVFIDEDGDGQYDLGEPVLEGVPIGLTNGEIILEAKTDVDGAFAFRVEPGVWQGVIYPPQGYSVINDATREVVIELEGAMEAVLDFALVPEDATDQGGEGTVEDSQEIEAEAGSDDAMSENVVQTEYYEGEAPVSVIVPDDSSDQGDARSNILGMILPESGSPIPLRWALVVFVLIILWVGAFLIFVGRRLLR